MAEAVVSAVVADVVGRAISLLAGQLRDRRGVDAKMWRLRHLVVKLESAVEAAGARRITIHEPRASRVALGARRRRAPRALLPRRVRGRRDGRGRG